MSIRVCSLISDTCKEIFMAADSREPLMVLPHPSCACAADPIRTHSRVDTIPAGLWV